MVACMAAACSRGGEDASSPVAPGRPGEVRVGVGEDIWPLTGQGPTSRHFAAGELNVGVYEPLLSLGPDYSLRPGLAERWELVGPTTWRFHLRRGVTFHDGRPFGADDVVWSWSREALIRSVGGTLDRVVKVDDLTVDFVLTAPSLRLPEQLVHPEGPIVPRNGHNDSEPAVGTGPFRLVEYQPRRQVVVERFDGYWGAKAEAQRVTFKFLPDAGVRLEALRGGEVDIMTGVPREQATAVEGEGFRLVRAQPGATQALAFDTDGPFGDDRSVRQAVSLAVDRRRYVAEVLGGNGEPGRWMSPPAVLGAAASSVEPPAFDPARARQVLDEAGWRAGPDGVRAKGTRRLDLVLLGGPAAPEAGLQLVADQLRDVGIETNVRKAYDIRTGEENRRRGYDLDLSTANQNDASPAFLLTSRDVPGPAYAALVTQAVTAPTREEVQRAAAAMTRVLVNEQFLVVPLASVFHIYAMHDGVDLAEPHPSSINQTWVTLRPPR
ncbi:MAG TPA: ABC transporter substrate-binding protein [Acidimicrobiales bacterium]|nr:ABC transporter substrate-binding protein [Acidimicrobiales bacterium]